MVRRLALTAALLMGAALPASAAAPSAGPAVAAAPVAAALGGRSRTRAPLDGIGFWKRPTRRPPTLPGVPPPVPLDGGAGLLALAGAAFAARRLRGRR